MVDRLQKLLEKRAEKLRKKQEREDIKKEKAKEKKKQQRKERAKKLKKKLNQRAYAKRRKEELERRNKTGNDVGPYSIYIMKNNRKIRSVGLYWWKKDAYEAYNNAIQKNQENTRFPDVVETKRYGKSGKSFESQKIKYEIVMVKKVKEGEKTESSFRNEQGKFIKNVILDSNTHIIVEKHDWLVEKKFCIYGYHPYKDKKTYNFILNNMLFCNDDVGEDMRRVMVFKHRVIIQHLEDFDYVTCYDNHQAKQLYDMLQDDVIKAKKKYIVFMGEVVPDRVSQWIDKFEEKTGICRLSLGHCHISH